MVAGHLREKNGYYHMVLNYVDEYGKRHTPSKSTGLTVKGNKKRAEKMLSEARAAKEAELEARAIERSTGKAPIGTILFTAFLLVWLEKCHPWRHCAIRMLTQTIKRKLKNQKVELHSMKWHWQICGVTENGQLW